MKKELKIYLASPRGFCAGVKRAIDIVEKSINKFGSPVYVRHEIVHNKQVVEELKKKGAIFVDELSDVEDKKRPVIFSAHGVPKSVPQEAKLKNLSFVDATCPLVSKVHRESEQLYKRGFEILLIGHKNHPEVIGTMGQLPQGSIKLIETKNNLEIISKTLTLRKERSSLLGYDNFPHFKLETEMALNSKNVKELLMSVWEPARRRAKSDKLELQKLLSKDAIKGIKSLGLAILRRKKTYSKLFNK